MKAVRIHEYGSREVLKIEDVPVPEIADDEVLIRIFATSVISTRKVDSPPARLSPAPIRVKIRSIMQMSAEVAGTKEPTCAIRAIKATWRR